MSNSADSQWWHVHEISRMIRMMLNDVERAMKFEGKVAEFFCWMPPWSCSWGIRDKAAKTNLECWQVGSNKLKVRSYLLKMHLPSYDLSIHYHRHIEDLVMPVHRYLAVPARPIGGCLRVPTAWGKMGMAQTEQPCEFISKNQKPSYRQHF